jgi:MFS family permease
MVLSRPSKSLTKEIAIQGLGGGSVASLTYIVVSDMVPLRERGVFNSLLSMSGVSSQIASYMH